MERDARYFGLASRIAAELGANYVKTYFVEEGFERVTSGCPVPIVIAGGKKLPELDALTMAYKAIDQGASGVDMGRNIFQAKAPTAMIRSVAAVAPSATALIPFLSNIFASSAFTSFWVAQGAAQSASTPQGRSFA